MLPVAVDWPAKGAKGTPMVRLLAMSRRAAAGIWPGNGSFCCSCGNAGDKINEAWSLRGLCVCVKGRTDEVHFHVVDRSCDSIGSGFGARVGDAGLGQET